MLSISRAEATRQALKVFVRSHHNVNVDAFGLWAASKPGNHARKTDSKYE
jgi:hypothetical protein